MITGESLPVCKEVGDAVYAGTLNLDANLIVECTAEAGQGTIWRLIELVRSARRVKGRYECLADRVSGWFIPLVAAIALATLWGHGSTRSTEQGIQAALAVLLIACPCALGIATPMAVWAALGVASQSQVLFRNGESLERLASIRALRFDKTGTLAVADPGLGRFVDDGEVNLGMLRQIAAALVQGSSHTFSAALAAWAGQTDGATHASVQTLAGRGLQGIVTVDGQSLEVLLGSPRLMRERDQSFNTRTALAVKAALEQGESVSCLAWQGSVRGVFVFRERLRPEAPAAIRACVALGCHVAVLTGDHRHRAARIAQELGISCESEMLPADKVEAVQTARKHWGGVAMVGDGINDAPALAAADVGVGMGCGADVSRDSAAVCLMSNDLLRLPWAIRLSRATVRTMRRNLFWAFFYNVCGVGLAAAGMLTPVWAALAMVLSSAFVVASSLNLTRFPAPRDHTARIAQHEELLDESWSSLASGDAKVDAELTLPT